MYAAISGLKVHQTMLDVTSNDIANVNTLGYKSQRVRRSRTRCPSCSAAPPAPNAAQGGSNAAQVGLGVQLGSIDNMMSTGALQTTGNPLDVAHPGRRASSASANADPAAGAGRSRHPVHARRATSRATQRAT